MEYKMIPIAAVIIAWIFVWLSKWAAAPSRKERKLKTAARRAMYHEHLSNLDEE
jgi:hypothetical protein